MQKDWYGSGRRENETWLEKWYTHAFDWLFFFSFENVGRVIIGPYGWFLRFSGFSWWNNKKGASDGVFVSVRVLEDLDSWNADKFWSQEFWSMVNGMISGCKRWLSRTDSSKWSMYVV